MSQGVLEEQQKEKSECLWSKLEPKLQYPL